MTGYGYDYFLLIYYFHRLGILPILVCNAQSDKRVFLGEFTE